MKQFFVVIMLLCTLLLSSCGSNKAWTYEELSALTENFSDAMYCSNLAIVANAPEYVETIEKDGGSYKIYKVTPNEMIRGMDKVAEVKLEVPVDENGCTVLDDLNSERELLIFAYKSGKNYLVFSPFCVTEIDSFGRLIWDDLETKAIENNFPFYDLAHVKESLTEYLPGIEDDITPELIAQFKAQISEMEETGESLYFENLNWDIKAISYEVDILENHGSRYAKMDSKYTGIKKYLYYTASWSVYLEEEDIANFGKKGLVLGINNHSFSDCYATFFYDFKTDTLVRYT